ncbi:hypothetical protein [Deinococcus sp.]|uniref:hypothetical protein n=1 Tax=Deinococcus sp. TaxID=47478 RepID=UPI003B5AF39D
MTARTVNPASARRLALGALWVQVAALVVYGVYDALRGGPAWWLGTADVVLATLSLGLWTVLLGVFLRGVAVDASDRRLTAFRLIFPWLIALRASIWLLSTLAILGDAGNNANPVAVLTLFLVWGGNIVAGLVVYAVSAVLFVKPADAAGRARLLTWLNVAAALGAGIALMNIWPPTGFVPAPAFQDQLISGVQGALDVTATLLALRAVQVAPVAERERVRG